MVDPAPDRFGSFSLSRSFPRTADRRSVNRGRGSDPNDPVESEHGREAARWATSMSRRSSCRAARPSRSSTSTLRGRGGGRRDAAPRASRHRRAARRRARRSSVPGCEASSSTRSTGTRPRPTLGARAALPGVRVAHRDAYDQDTVERFDDVLNAATDALIGTLEEVSRDNMREEIDRFVAALQPITSCRSTSERPRGSDPRARAVVGCAGDWRGRRWALRARGAPRLGWLVVGVAGTRRGSRPPRRGEAPAARRGRVAGGARALDREAGARRHVARTRRAARPRRVRRPTVPRLRADRGHRPARAAAAGGA